MKTRLLALSFGVLAAAPALGDTTLSGVCPDGSYFIVQSRHDVPCANPHFAAPSDLPPVRPYLLPKPYTWYVDQEARNPNNPYNLVEAAQKIRDARAGISSEPAQAPRPGAAPAPQAARMSPPPTHAAGPPEPPAKAPAVALPDSDLRDLVRLVALRQEASPATLEIANAHGQKSLKIELAYSSSFEAFALHALSRRPGDAHVLVWTAQAERDADFHANFFVVQGGRTFRPDPANGGEIGFLLGAPGALPSGEMAVGYLVMPASFDPSASLDLFWNDRSVAAVLAPPVTAGGTH